MVSQVSFAIAVAFTIDMGSCQATAPTIRKKNAVYQANVNKRGQVKSTLVSVDSLCTCCKTYAYANCRYLYRKTKRELRSPLRTGPLVSLHLHLLEEVNRILDLHSKEED